MVDISYAVHIEIHHSQQLYFGMKTSRESWESWESGNHPWENKNQFSRRGAIKTTWLSTNLEIAVWISTHSMRRGRFSVCGCMWCIPFYHKGHKQANQADSMYTEKGKEMGFGVAEMIHTDIEWKLYLIERVYHSTSCCNATLLFHVSGLISHCIEFELFTSELNFISLIS